MLHWTFGTTMLVARCI